MRFDQEDLKFEWDQNKAAFNAEKHGIHFEEAVQVFLDREAEIIRYGRRHGEICFELVGQVRGRLILVVYTERGDRIRIISARKPDKDEQRKYRQIRSRS